jgi:hypothetical protein
VTIEEYLRGRPEFANAHTSSKGRLLVRCPFHPDRKPSFSLDVKEGWFKCRSASCGVKGGFHKLFRMLEGVNGHEAKARMERLVPDAGRVRVGRTDEDHNPFTMDDEEEAAGPVVGPVAYPVPEFLCNPWSTRLAADYLRGRLVSEATTQLFGVQFGTGGVVRNRLVLPYFDLDRQYTTWTSRAVLSTDRMRYYAPDNAGTTAFLYGAHVFSTQQRACAIVEGQFDVMRLWELGLAAVGLGGAQISPAQLVRFRLLWERAGRLPWLVLLDAGAEAAARRVADEVRVMLNSCPPVGVHTTGAWGVKDPGVLPQNWNPYDELHV